MIVINLKMAAKEAKVFDINSYKPPTFPWFKKSLITPHVGNNPSDKGLLPFINEEHEKKFLLLQYSIPPYFNSKYHNFNLENYIDEFKDDKWKKYVNITTGCLFWNQELGFQILTYIESVNYCERSEGTRANFALKMDNFIGMLHRDFYDGMNITNDDLCQSSIDFLYDECILIQLPWKATLFYQWLLAAWAECLIIEKETLEFRHWKIPENLKTLIISILDLIKQLKSRIILGFIILNTHTFYCDKNSDRFDRVYSINIIDNVVIPSLPILEYITNGDAMECVTNIKSVILMDHDCVKVCVQSLSYKLKYVLDAACCSFAYNFRPWLDDPIPPLFRIVPEKIETIAAEINHHMNTSKDKNILIKDMTVNECQLLDVITSNLKDNNFETQILKFTIKAIIDKVINQNLVIGLSAEEVEQEFMSVENRKRSVEIFDKSIEKDVKHRAIQQALMYSAANRYLVDMHTYDSAIIQILGLQLEILEREQIIRLAHSCSIIFNKKTTLNCNQSVKPTKTIEQSQIIIKKINTRIKKQKRDAFWLRFPKKWRESIDTTNKLSLIKCSDDIENYINESINKIGQIIFNYAKENLETAIPMELYFDHVNVVHYILPSVIYIFAIEYTKNENNIIYFQTIQELIQLYQLLYVSRNTPQNLARMKESNTDVSIKGVNLQETLNYIKICKGLCEATKQICSYATTKVENNGMEVKLVYALRRTRNWQDNFILDKLKTYNCILFTLSQWSKFVYVFMYNFNFTFKQSFKVPEVKISEDCFSHYPKLNELYFTSIALLDLSCIYDMLPDVYKTHKKMPAETIKSIEITFRSTCHSIFCAIMNHRKNAISSSELQASNSLHNKVDKKWVKDCMGILHGFYKLLKEFKETHGIPPITLQLLPYIYHNPEVMNIVMLFLKGELTQIETILPIFGSPDGIMKVCRKCKKLEMSSGKSFLVCEKCIEQKYPDRNFFCSRRCKFDWWKEEHMAEHLEFELGLSDFCIASSSKVNK